MSDVDENAILEYVKPLYRAYYTYAQKNNVLIAHTREVMQTIELNLRTYFNIGFEKVEVFKQHTDPRIPIIHILLE